MAEPRRNRRTVVALAACLLLALVGVNLASSPEVGAGPPPGGEEKIVVRRAPVRHRGPRYTDLRSPPFSPPFSSATERRTTAVGLASGRKHAMAIEAIDHLYIESIRPGLPGRAAIR